MADLEQLVLSISADTRQMQKALAKRVTHQWEGGHGWPEDQPAPIDWAAWRMERAAAGLSRL